MFLREGGVAVTLQGGFGLVGRGGDRLVSCCLQWGVFIVDFRVVVFLFLLECVALNSFSVEQVHYTE